MSRHTDTTFAERLKEAQGDMTTEALARRIDVSLRVVQRWRSGKGEPNGASLSRLCLALGKPVSFFYDNGDKAA